MDEKFSIRGLNSCSDNLKSKTCTELSRSIQNRKWVEIFAIVVAFTMCGEIRTAAQTLAFRVQSLEVSKPDDIDRAFTAISRGGVDALLVFADPFLSSQRNRIFDLATKNRLLAMYGQSDPVEAGGLMSYAPSFREFGRRAAYYVDKILKGTKPADLPVEQPTKFEFVVNLKAAKQIGLTISPNVRARADKVIR